jgi:hypothetical protein
MFTFPNCIGCTDCLHCDKMGPSHTVLLETHGLILQMRKLRLREVLPGVWWPLLASSAPTAQRLVPVVHKGLLLFFLTCKSAF